MSSNSKWRWANTEELDIHDIVRSIIKPHQDEALLAKQILFAVQGITEELQAIVLNNSHVLFFSMGYEFGSKHVAIYEQAVYKIPGKVVNLRGVLTGVDEFAQHTKARAVMVGFPNINEKFPKFLSLFGYKASNKSSTKEYTWEVQ